MISTKTKLNGGQVMLTATIFFLIVSLTIIFGLTEPLVKQKRITSDIFLSRQSYFLAESAIEDTIARLKTGKEVLASEAFTLSGSTATVTTTDTLDGKEIIAEGEVDELVREVAVAIMLGSGVSFHYGMQSGTGGIILENSSSVVGNVYSNGSVVSSGPVHNYIYGEVISAGPSGLVDHIHSTSSVYARTIRNSIIDKNAYFQTITGSTVAGTQYPNSEDQVVTTLPIPDTLIDEWKAEAEAGGVISTPCPYTITSATTIGPVKIGCDLEISGNNYIVTIAGNVWVEGNIVIKNSPTLKIPSSLGNKGIAVIADNPSNRLTSSKITLENSAVFQGSGSSRSYIFFISQNQSAENGGTEPAINVQNTVSGDLLVYAGHGELQLANSVELKEATAYRIRLKNTAQVKYKTGLVNLLFSSGPGGGYELLNWREVQ